MPKEMKEFFKDMYQEGKRLIGSCFNKYTCIIFLFIFTVLLVYFLASKIILI
jgi:hypothetical protein